MDIHVSLTEDLAEFIETQVASGRYQTSSEVIQDALRLMEEQDREQDLQRLRSAWSEGVASGDYRSLDLDAIKAEGRRRLSGKL